MHISLSRRLIVDSRAARRRIWLKAHHDTRRRQSHQTAMYVSCYPSPSPLHISTSLHPLVVLTTFSPTHLSKKYALTISYRYILLVPLLCPLRNRLGYGWHRIFPLHHALLLPWCRRVLTGVRCHVPTESVYPSLITCTPCSPSFMLFPIASPIRLDFPGFLNARTWLADVRAHADPHLTCILVGNKIDLCPPEPEPEPASESLPESESSDTTAPRPLETSTSAPPHSTHDAFGPVPARRRQVPAAEAAAWAREEGLLFVEASAKSGSGVDRAFEDACRDILDKIRRGVFDDERVSVWLFVILDAERDKKNKEQREHGYQRDGAD